MPFFISLFLGIRGLANYPLESMMHGGIFWFQDLTMADPYYILPVFTAVTMFITMEVYQRSLNIRHNAYFSFI